MQSNFVDIRSTSPTSRVSISLSYGLILAGYTQIIFLRKWSTYRLGLGQAYADSLAPFKDLTRLNIFVIFKASLKECPSPHLFLFLLVFKQMPFLSEVIFL